MSLKHIQKWWERIGCIRDPGVQTGEESALLSEVKELREALQQAEDAAIAAVAYDRAIANCAGDPEKMTSFCTAEGGDLDSLYDDWIQKSRQVLEN